jgi:HK97 family phage portal protein
MSLRDRLVKALFGGVIRAEIEKSSRQIVSHVTGISLDEGVLPEVDFEVYNQMYEQTSWVRAVVGVICKAVTARGYSLVPCRPNADPKNAELLQEFFSNCNPNDTFLEILDDLTRDDYVFGNAFLEIVHGPDGKPRELWNLDATTMRVKADEHGAILGYVQVPRMATTRGHAGKVPFEPREVIHFKLGTKGATLYGLSPLASLILPVTVDKFAQVYNRAFFVNGAKIRGAFIMKDATPEQVERNREYLAARAKNPDLAHSDLVLEGDIEFKQVGVNQKDMEFLQLREFTRNEILAVYGVPPGKVSIIETGNIGAGTGEHQTQTFYEETILPFQMRVAEKINKHIVRKGFGIQDWSFQFNKRAIDEKDQAEIFNLYLQNGVFAPDEVRRLVAPRMPELQKSLTPRQTVVGASRGLVEIENRFVDALARVFREIKAGVTAQLPALRGGPLPPKVKALPRHFETGTVPLGGLALRDVRFPEAAKQLDELEVLLELIDKDRIARVLERFTLEAARKGLSLSAGRAGREADVDEPSLALKEKLKANAISLAGHVSEALKASLRQALIDGIAADETVPQLMRRIEEQLDSGATVRVRPVLDAQGNVLRAGGARRLDRATAAELIARTEANRAYNEGNLDALKQAGVERAQWLLASDACPVCVELAETAPGEKLGKIMPIDEASGELPAHPNCRCTFISVTES